MKYPGLGRDPLWGLRVEDAPLAFLSFLSGGDMTSPIQTMLKLGVALTQRTVFLVLDFPYLLTYEK